MVAVLQPTQKGKLIAIDRAVVLVGRSADCDAVITSSQKISRKHCCLVQADDCYFVRDLGSMNGIWVNDRKVTREAPLIAGDKLSIGDVEYRFHTNVRLDAKRQSTSSDAATAELNTPRQVVLVDNSRDTGSNGTPSAAEVIVEVVDSGVIDADDVVEVEVAEVLSVEAMEAIDDVEVLEGSSEEVEIVDAVNDVVVLEEDDEYDVPVKGPGRRDSSVTFDLDDADSDDNQDLLYFDD